ncbi:hypothetical protein EOM89_11330 [Candidatus Falkowbacteria bacterium]|nr:hypothetical protein [Candidatus Falkowbacteria bacterium]
MDPFAKYETLARGGIPAAPPQPAQPDPAPRRAVADGIKVTTDRLDALDRIARTHRATQSGLAERVADLRAERQDAQRRMALLSSRANGDPRAHADTTLNAAQIEAELANLAAAIAETEAELTSAAEAAGAARSNLKAAVALAREYGLAVPAGVMEGRASA